MENNGDIVKRIKETRAERGLSQKAFGERLGVGRDVIKNIELELVEVKEHMINLIALEFGINKEWILTGEGPKETVDKIDPLADFIVKIKMGRNPFAEQYIDFLASLTDEEWEVFERQTEIMQRFYKGLNK